jgi:riboflavin synthase
MFTGIIEAVGTVRAVGRNDRGVEIAITHLWTDVRLGESIAVNGACLTVEAMAPNDFTFHIIQTSLDRTNFATYGVGRRVNLERAVRVDDRLGGHIVQGHVDGIGTVRQVRNQEDARLLDLEVPPDVARISMPLASVTVDGVSLTVNAVPGPQTIQISLIPFTLQHTTLHELRSGDRVHLEADAIGKYVDHLLRERGKERGESER